ncbi:N-acyl amino acid synthase FeeM domain-containing protein [Pelosinus baikalensis]|uniref:GNAT family N-acetyltransferase n=1 Tax=Pelosinus baikalensis TaxID=2892015 RepID=A0ABS8I167_9FIRM|nr:GNAT family N-acyltransferase [Pelosinus baikalensis]MCC5468219.1 GNAT family N-acetyltransferase [Pelosinus baikalensis]
MKAINSNIKSNTTETSESLIKISIATTPEEKKEVYHFRYQTYVEEMSKHLEDIDYDQQLLWDELDEWTILLYAKIDCKIIATARVNIGNIKDFPAKVVNILSLKTFESYYPENEDPKFAYVTKLMVAPSYRRTPMLYLLIAQCYQICCNNQVQFAFGGCNFHLVRLYEQMGFHHYGKNFVYPGYGLLTPIVLVINDIHHLRQVRSPLFRIARKRGKVNTQSVERFHEKFTRHASIVNSQLVTEEELWSILCKVLECLPTEAISLLRELSETEAKKFLHSCGIVVQCDTGDIITNQGDISYSYNILLSGKLQSLTFLNPVKEYISGQHFGANGLTEHNKNTEDIAAITPTQILVLSGMAFPRFFHSQPNIAHKIVQTMRSLTNKLVNM